MTRRFLPALLVLAAACASGPATRGGAPAPPPVGADTIRVYALEDVPVTPALTNGSEVVRLIGVHYPAGLRETRAGGSAVLAFVVGTDGRPRDVRVERGSGFTELGAASVTVGKAMRFTPGRVDGRAVPVLVRMPVTWRAPQ